MDVHHKKYDFLDFRKYYSLWKNNSFLVGKKFYIKLYKRSELTENNEKQLINYNSLFRRKGVKCSCSSHERHAEGCKVVGPCRIIFYV